MNPPAEPNQESANTRSPFRSRYVRLSWLVGCVVVACVIWVVGWGNISQALTQMNPWLFAAAIGLDATSLWVRALKWRYVLGPGRQAFGIHFLSKLAGNYSPGRIGEFSPLLLRQHRDAKLGAWIVVDRLLEMSVTIGMGALGLVMLRFIHLNLMMGLAAILILIIAVLMVLLTYRHWFDGFRSRFRQGSRLDRLADAMGRISEEVLLLRTVILPAAAMTVFGTVLEITALVTLYRSFGLPGVTFAMAAAAKCAQGVVGSLPVSPGPTGLPHVTAGAFLRGIGGFSGASLAAALATREVAVNILFWIFLGLTAPSVPREKGSSS